MKEKIQIHQQLYSSFPSRSKRRKHLLTAVLILCMAVLFCLPALAVGETATPTLWDKAKTIMQDVYNKILGISTIALLLMNFSKNDRTVGESRAWLKRIIVSWALLNGLGFIMSYITPFFADGKWTP